MTVYFVGAGLAGAWAFIIICAYCARVLCRDFGGYPADLCKLQQEMVVYLAAIHLSITCERFRSSEDWQHLHGETGVLWEDFPTCFSIDDLPAISRERMKARSELV